MTTPLSIEFVQRNRLFCAMDELFTHKRGIIQNMQRVVDNSDDIIYSAYTVGLATKKPIDISEYGFTFNMFGHSSVFIYANVIDKGTPEFDYKEKAKKFIIDHGFAFPYEEEYKCTYRVYEHNNFNVLFVIKHVVNEPGEEEIPEIYHVELKGK